MWVRAGRELLQPTLRDASDYELRVVQMLQTLSHWTEQSPDTLAEEMVHEGSDISEWRAKGAEARDFSVPLEDGLALVHSVRNAFVAAANASIQRRGYFGLSTLKAARQHARVVRMGQTRRGSYVVPIISRVPGAVEQPDDPQGRFEIDVSAQPFERRVMAQLAEALKTVEALAVQADREPTQRELNESIGSGVSYELCSALDTALSADSFAPLDVTFSWARRASTHPDVREIELPRDSREIVHRMAENLRGSDIVAEQILTGWVWQTQHEPGENAGEVKIKASIGKQTRTVNVSLNADQMHEAYQAADQQKPIYMRGRLVREQGRTWFFESISEFGVAEAAPISWGRGHAEPAEPSG